MTVSMYDNDDTMGADKPLTSHVVCSVGSHVSAQLSAAMTG